MGLSMTDEMTLKKCEADGAEAARKGCERFKHPYSWAENIVSAKDKREQVAAFHRGYDKEKGKAND